MDHAWAAEQLGEFRAKIDLLRAFYDAEGEDYDELVSIHGSYGDVVDRLISLDPVMRELMDAARPGLGEYAGAEDNTGWSFTDRDYWLSKVRHRVLQAIGIHELGAEARRRMKPDSPDLTADHLHSWVWEAAAPMWNAGSRQEAVNAAGRSVNARLQQKLDRHDISEADLCHQAFSKEPSARGKPRLRFPGDQNTDTWKSRLQGAMEYSAGCFMAIRNPAAHEHELDLPEQMALEQLAAFSVLARWIEECYLDTYFPPPPELPHPRSSGLERKS